MSVCRTIYIRINNTSSISTTSLVINNIIIIYIPQRFAFQIICKIPCNRIRTCVITRWTTIIIFIVWCLCFVAFPATKCIPFVQTSLINIAKGIRIAIVNRFVYHIICFFGFTIAIISNPIRNFFPLSGTSRVCFYLESLSRIFIECGFTIWFTHPLCERISRSVPTIRTIFDRHGFTRIISILINWCLMIPTTVISYLVIRFKNCTHRQRTRL